MDEIDLERIITLSYDDSHENPEYINAITKTIELGREIMKALGPKNRLFLEYEKYLCSTNDICLMSAYKLGYKDKENYAQQLAQQNINNPSKNIN